MVHIKRNSFKILMSIFSIFGFMFISVGIGIMYALETDETNINVINDSKNLLTYSDLKSGQSELLEKQLKPVFYNSMADAVFYSKSYPTSFKAKLVHYGPDCASCGGRLGCNGQNAKNGNIYYNDKEFGKIRIVAASTLLPCGSILKINLDAYNNMYVIVLDRGVDSSMIDLLKESQRSKSPVRTVNNVVFDIVRYGY